ncbi:hypothetical protein ACFY03_22370 [Micromonospora chersina]|uniref:hypothetical protein n=1 Tax=Micromonospora chersina TaxID=47854 RepID=UPI003698DC9A
MATRKQVSRRLAELNTELLNALAFSIGAGLILWAWLIPGSNGNLKVVLLSVGTSIVATTILAYLSSHYTIRQNQIKEMCNHWKIEAIYATRAEMNVSSNEALRECAEQLDIIAFGLKSFRETQTPLLRKKVAAGVRVRILTIKPDSIFVKQRERDENEVPGQIRKTIEDLRAWANELAMAAKKPSNVQLRFYDALPLDFYFRVDRKVYVGPYMHGYSSHQTISMEFGINGAGFEYWTTYFDSLWSDSKFASEAAVTEGPADS